MPNLKPQQDNLTNKGKGRPKGAKNKFTTLKEAFLSAFEDIGGQTGLAKWAAEKKNRGHFYQMLARMLPNKHEAEVSHKEATKVIFEVMNQESKE